MTYRAIGIGFAALVVLAIIGGASFFLGGNSALSALSIVSVTADQIESAMSDDNFYGLYRENTLLVSGIVAGMTRQNRDTRIELKTNAISKVYCDIGDASASVNSGDALRILAEAATAERLPSGILLTNCKLL